MSKYKKYAKRTYFAEDNESILPEYVKDLKEGQVAKIIECEDQEDCLKPTKIEIVNKEDLKVGDVFVEKTGNGADLKIKLFDDDEGIPGGGGAYWDDYLFTMALSGALLAAYNFGIIPNIAIFCGECDRQIDYKDIALTFREFMKELGKNSEDYENNNERGE
jgi:hypothetical protein